MTIGELARRVAVLEHQVHVLQRRRLSRDGDTDARFLGEIAAAFGQRIFSAVDLVAMQAADPSSAIAGLDRRAVGSWLRRLRGRPVGAYQLDRVKRDDRGTLWCVRCISA